jgi:hypothetical protein
LLAVKPQDNIGYSGFKFQSPAKKGAAAPSLTPPPVG